MFVTSQIITMKDLCAILLELINRNKIRRLGNITWRWVSQQYCLYWCIKGVPCTKEIKKPSNIENIIPSDDNKNTCVDSLIESNPTNTLEENQNRSTKRKREDSENEESILFKKFCGNDALVDSECDVTFKYFEEGDSRIDDNEISANDAMDTFTNISEGLSNTETEPPKAEVNFVSPRPWIRPDGSLNRASLFHWMGAILNHVLLHPVMSLVELQKRFNYLQLHEIQFLIEVINLF